MRSKSILLFLLLLVPGSALAADGVLEINQTCAVQTGCFPGDVPGFPVTLPSSGSYRLTSNLSLDDTVALGIDVGGGNVRIDFAGFVLSGDPAFNGNQRGIGVISGSARRVVVENGLIVDFNSACIELGEYARVERMRLHSCGTALDVGEESLVWGNIASLAATGMILGDGSSFRDNQVSNNAGTADISGGIASGVNVCNGVPCSVFPPRRRYYLTTTTSQGSGALGLCEAGFHLATLAEIADTAALEYASDLGRNAPDSGDGPPAFFGWARTGGGARVSGDPGTTNCDLWTSSVFAEVGTAVGPRRAEFSDIQVGFWSVRSQSCSLFLSGWCIED